jgi:hypothetical protein
VDQSPPESRLNFYAEELHVGAKIKKPGNRVNSLKIDLQALGEIRSYEPENGIRKENNRISRETILDKDKIFILESGI